MWVILFAYYAPGNKFNGSITRPHCLLLYELLISISNYLIGKKWTPRHRCVCRCVKCRAHLRCRWRQVSPATPSPLSVSMAMDWQFTSSIPPLRGKWTWFLYATGHKLGLRDRTKLRASWAEATDVARMSESECGWRCERARNTKGRFNRMPVTEEDITATSSALFVFHLNEKKKSFSPTVWHTVASWPASQPSDPSLLSTDLSGFWGFFIFFDDHQVNASKACDLNPTRRAAQAYRSNLKSWDLKTIQDTCTMRGMAHHPVAAIVFSLTLKDDLSTM